MTERAAESSYRQVRVLIHPGTNEGYVTVVARTVSHGRTHDRLLYRTVVEVVDVSDLGAILRAASAACDVAANRL